MSQTNNCGIEEISTQTDREKGEKSSEGEKVDKPQEPKIVSVQTWTGFRGSILRER